MKAFIKIGWVISLFFFSSVYAHGFDPESVRLVDQRDNVYLFRGNLPILYPQSDEGAPQFAHDCLLSTFEKILKHPLPTDIELYDICLLSPWTEEKEIDVEKKFFKANPCLGKFLLHSIYGCILDPSHLTKLERTFLLKLPFLDGLKHLIHSIYHTYMQNVPQGKVRVLYIHCFAGYDRTGTVSGSYLMRYKNESFQMVKQINTDIASREIRPLSENELKWYAYYLKYEEDINVGPINEWLRHREFTRPPIRLRAFRQNAPVSTLEAS